MASDKVAMQIRIPPELHEKLKRISESEQRSFNNMVIYFLTIGAEDYFKDHPKI
ncbi:MAG: toxin-antitoxin system HicB family antitoxin [Clostridia bacterium]|nr:toxin-antitoxin system HicB family antitoxin [Clostridia bacterium]